MFLSSFIGKFPRISGRSKKQSPFQPFFQSFFEGNVSSIGRETLDKKGNGINLSSDKNLNHIFNKWKEILVRAQFLDFSAIFVDPPFLASDLSAPSTDRVNCTFHRPHPVKPPSIPGCRLWVVGTPCWLGTLPSVLLGVSNRYFFPAISQNA